MIQYEQRCTYVTIITDMNYIIFYYGSYSKYAYEIEYGTVHADKGAMCKFEYELPTWIEGVLL